jgi:hypothetical protein
VPEPLTVTQLLAAATEEMVAGGYREFRTGAEAPLDPTRVFEDAYGIVSLHVYETWGHLVDRWPLAQGHLVDLISAHLRKPEPKSWEGYLVLLTPGRAEADSRVNTIRYDTHRVRKLLATGEDLGTLNGLRSALLPLLPLSVEPDRAAEEGLLDRLPALLASRQIDQEVTAAVVSAFQQNESIVDALHTLRGER